MIDLNVDEALVLEFIGTGEEAGRDIRKMLQRKGHGYSGPGFCQMMDRLGIQGLVTHADKETVLAAGAAVLVLRHYRRTKDGHFALASTPTESAVDIGAGALILPP